MSAAPPARRRAWALGLAVAAVLAAALAGMVAWTAPVRRAVRAYTALLAAANRQDLDALRRLCSARYLRAHALRPAAEGGVVGIPRNIHPNFQAWRDGPDVLLCPTNRVGPIYRFVLERGAWRFDGPVGVLVGRGQVVRLPDQPEEE